METTNEILKDMDIEIENVLTVFNKMDKVDDEDLIIENFNLENKIFISAHNPQDIERLKEAIEASLQKEYQRKDLLIPFKDYAIYDEISNNFVIEKESSDEFGTTIQVYMNKNDLERYKDYYKS